jgi:phosphatidylglycerophosphate synthase
MEMQPNKGIVKHTYFSNWSDLFGYPIAWWITLQISRLKFASPNFITISAFLIYTLGCISLFLDYPYHRFAAALLIFMGYIGDNIDGQLARLHNLTSNTGDFLDKTLDVIKIFMISNSLGYSAYIQTQNITYLLLGSIAAYMFALRYYIKLETMFSRINTDKHYLSKSAEIRSQLEYTIDKLYKTSNRSFMNKLKVLLHKNKTFFLVDEGEFAVITSICSILNLTSWGIIFIATAQIFWAFFRFFERLLQIKTNSENLLRPLRK